MAMTRKQRTRLNSHFMIFNGKELLWTIGITAILMLFVLPVIWKRFESPEIEKDFRYSYKQRDNYYLYSVAAEKVCGKSECVFLGDSVIWGMYSDNHNTLTALLNKKLGKEYAGNLAVDGLHYIAMENLLKHYGSGIRNKKVYLYFNPLWMNSKLYDLSDTKDFGINHPRLLPQFDWNMPSYKATLAKRMSAVLEHYIPFYSWLNHLRVSFFGNQDFKTFAVEHPEVNPFQRINFHADALEREHQNGKQNWMEARIPKQDWDWVVAKDSKQVAAYMRIINLLKSRGNEVVAVIGTVNPYMQTEKSLQGYRKLLNDVTTKLKTENIPMIVLPELPSNEYADASHPLASGYDRLAEFLRGTDFFFPDKRK